MGTSDSEPQSSVHEVHGLTLFQLKKTHSAGCLTAYLKGAPERVLAKCSTYLKDGKVLPITEEFKQEYENAYNVCLFPLLHLLTHTPEQHC